MGVLEDNIMRYFKRIEDGYIIMIGTGNGGTEITDAEYDEIMSIIHNKPTETALVGYRLKTDMTWEEFNERHTKWWAENI